MVLTFGSVPRRTDCADALCACQYLKDSYFAENISIFLWIFLFVFVWSAIFVLKFGCILCIIFIYYTKKYVCILRFYNTSFAYICGSVSEIFIYYLSVWGFAFNLWTIRIVIALCHVRLPFDVALWYLRSYVFTA